MEDMGYGPVFEYDGNLGMLAQNDTTWMYIHANAEIEVRYYDGKAVALILPKCVKTYIIKYGVMICREEDVRAVSQILANGK